MTSQQALEYIETRIRAIEDKLDDPKVFNQAFNIIKTNLARTQSKLEVYESFTNFTTINGESLLFIKIDEIRGATNPYAVKKLTNEQGFALKQKEISK